MRLLQSSSNTGAGNFACPERSLLRADFPIQIRISEKRCVLELYREGVLGVKKGCGMGGGEGPAWMTSSSCRFRKYYDAIYPKLGPSLLHAV